MLLCSWPRRGKLNEQLTLPKVSKLTAHVSKCTAMRPQPRHEPGLGPNLILRTTGATTWSGGSVTQTVIISCKSSGARGPRERWYVISDCLRLACDVMTTVTSGQVGTIHSEPHNPQSRGGGGEANGDKLVAVLVKKHSQMWEGPVTK